MNIVHKIFLTGLTLVIISLLGVPVNDNIELPVKPGVILLDILTFNGVITGFSMLPGVSNGGIGLELKQNGNLKRSVKECFSFWDYEYRLPSSKSHFKKEHLLIAHPLIGYQFSNYLLSKGYNKKMTLLTTMLGVYVLEKGIQGSFETPSAYDILSYFSGAVISVAVNERVEKLYHKHFIYKPVAAVLNPFLLFQSGRSSYH
jgi:hypothetical protein